MGYICCFSGPRCLMQFPTCPSACSGYASAANRVRSLSRLFRHVIAGIDTRQPYKSSCFIVMAVAMAREMHLPKSMSLDQGLYRVHARNVRLSTRAHTYSESLDLLELRLSSDAVYCESPHARFAPNNSWLSSQGSFQTVAMCRGMFTATCCAVMRSVTKPLAYVNAQVMATYASRWVFSICGVMLCSMRYLLHINFSLSLFFYTNTRCCPLLPLTLMPAGTCRTCKAPPLYA